MEERNDMISKLPDTLISQILFYLPTKEAVRSCVLSNRWKSLWRLIPKLDLDSSDFPDYRAFVSFMNMFIDLTKEHKSCLLKPKLRIQKGENDPSCVTRWIEFFATSKLKHLDVEFGPLPHDWLELMPSSLFMCEKLLYLSLHRVSLGKVDYVYLPCLKIMRLGRNVNANEALLESLISCLLLEDLGFVKRTDDIVKVLRVRSQTLTTLCIAIDGDLEVLIDAPRL